MKKESAFSGLEAAIVLIAFVVVAAVFSYVMLGAGFFATQKSQEVTYSGIKQSTSNIVLDGQIYGALVAPGGKLETIDFYLSIPEGGQPQKKEDISFLLTVDNGPVEDMKTVTVFTPTAAAAPVLSVGDRAKATITLTTYNTNAGGPLAGGSFTLEIKPKVGASTLVAKTLATGYNGGVII